MTRATAEIRALPLSTAAMRALQAGGLDTHGQPPEHLISDGLGTPCRHCLRDVPAGRGSLLLAYRPFPEPQPYAETGPIFLCADPCTAWDGAGPPPILTTSRSYHLRGYDRTGRIVSGTGGVVARASLWDRAAALLADPEIVEAHVRSAANGCYQCRLRRG